MNYWKVEIKKNEGQRQFDQVEQVGLHENGSEANQSKANQAAHSIIKTN